MRHADEARLHAYLDGEREWLGEDPATLERHLEGCTECRERLQRVRRLREAGRALLGGEAWASLEPPPFARVEDRARGDVARVRAARRSRTALAWAASILLALSAGWLARSALLPEERIASTVERPARVARGADAPRTAAPTPAARRVATPAEPATRERPEAPAPSPRRGEARAEAERPPAAPVAPVAPESAAARAEQAEPAPALADATADGPEPAAGTAVASAPPASASGRALRIEGRVTDPDGRPVQGASVSIVGSVTRAVTGPDGSYALVGPARPAPAESLVVVAASVGYESATRSVGAADAPEETLDFRLQPMLLRLEEAVVVGYASPRARARATDAGWRPADAGAARRILGREAPSVPGLAVLGFEVGRSDGARAVRIRQALEDGAVLTLVARRTGGAAERTAPAADGGAGVSLELGELRIVASAPLPDDSLRALLRGVR